jgi:hypothetical protein
MLARTIKHSPKAFLKVSAILIALAIMFTLIWFSKGAETGAPKVVFGLIVLIAFFGLNFAVRRVVITEHGISSHYLLKGTEELRWEEIDYSVIEIWPIDRKPFQIRVYGKDPGNGTVAVLLRDVSSADIDFLMELKRLKLKQTNDA